MNKKSSSEEIINEFKESLIIDKYNLEEAVQTQATLYFAVSDALAQEISKRDAYKKAMEEVYAMASLEFRQESAKQGVKMTEDQIKQSALLDKAYQTLQNDYLSQRLLCDRLSALKEAFSNRGYMIRDLVSLWIAGYFSDNAVKADEKIVESVRYDIARQAISEKRRPITRKST